MRIFGKIMMGRTPRLKTTLLILLTTMILTTTLLITISKEGYIQLPEYQQKLIILDNKQNQIELINEKNWRGLNNDELTNLTVLGRYLFLQEPLSEIETNNKMYNILVWKYGKTIENRHLKHFSNEYIDPFRHCSVNNCKITYNDSEIEMADIVIFHLHRMKSIKDLPKTERRPEQIWTFLTDESPYHTFLSSHKLTDYNGIFNWSMTYRMNSDIPVPYGRTIIRQQTQKPDNITITKRKDVLVAILGSNCGGKNNRWKYVKELQKHINVDVYGGCGPFKTCPGQFRENCHDIDGYLFYLAFENSNCDEYITEKLWWNSYEKNSIPIIMGSDKKVCSKLLPPNSYLHVEDYAKPIDLATYILYLNKTGEYKNYYQWKQNFQILNEHGYFKSESFHYCRVCEALNFNKKTYKVYENLEKFWSVANDCHEAWDKQL